MIRAITAIALTVAAASCQPAAAAVTRLCLPHADAVENLFRNHGEQRIGMGPASRGRSYYELFVSETGSWTILVTGIDGLSCVGVAGEGWNKFDPVDLTESGT